MKRISITSACPACGLVAERETYDIGSGPELSCANCEWCWGAEGQDLKPLPRHADALFEAKYGFCRIDCDLCKRLDEEAKARPDYDQEAAIEAGWKLAMVALADVGLVSDDPVSD
jgi:hypothetical protein